MGQSLSRTQSLRSLPIYLKNDEYTKNANRGDKVVHVPTLPTSDTSLTVLPNHRIAVAHNPSKRTIQVLRSLK